MCLAYPKSSLSHLAKLCVFQRRNHIPLLDSSLALQMEVPAIVTASQEGMLNSGPWCVGWWSLEPESDHLGRNSFLQQVTGN